MRLPNGYGGVIKLSGKRRKPFAVRITTGTKEVDGRFIQQYKYIGYFTKRAEAMSFLADYNKGIVLPEAAQSISDMLTFEEVYKKWWEEQQRIKPKSASAINNYKMAFGYMSSLHSRKFATIRTGELQEVLLSRSHMSKSTISFMMVVLHGMYKYALRWDIVDRDYSQGLEAVYSRDKSIEHKPFTDEEIEALWASCDATDASLALILIYTGMRCSELLNLRTKNIHLDERYMIGGIKTEAGKDRVIPIADKIYPLIANHIDNSTEYLLPNEYGRAWSYARFNQLVWKPLMERMDMEHRTHDCRHTFATLSARAGISDYHRKLIMGHTVKDLTNGVYTHVSPAELVADVNLL